MQNLGLILLVFSFVCFCLSLWQVTDPNWRKLIGAGLAFLVAAEIFGGIAALHMFKG